MHGLADLPLALRRYLLLVIAAGAAAALLPVPFAGRAVEPERVALLVALAVAAELVTIHLTHKTAVNPVTACHVALVLTAPAGIAPALALLAGLTGQLLRHRRDPVEATFNAAQGALAVGAAAVVWHLGGSPAGVDPRFSDPRDLAALLGAAAALHVANTALVAVAAALHLGRPPLRVFIVHLADEVAPHAALIALGVTTAHLALHAPLLLPTMAAPLWLVRVAMRENVRLRDDTHEALAAMVEVVELRDPYTAGHSRRVADVAHALALALGLAQEEADLIRSAGRVHDVGKVAIDPAVLTKPGKLTEAEFAEMRRHPGLGADVIARFDAFQAGVPLVRHHHERWDGAGYPDGLAGERIPLGARILAVADTYDALTSTRAYRAAMPRERALAILGDGAGTQWDPAVVAALLALVRDAAPELQAGVTPLREAA